MTRLIVSGITVVMVLLSFGVLVVEPYIYSASAYQGNGNNDNWHMYRHDLRRSGALSTDDPSLKGKTLLFIPTQDGIYCLDASDGSIFWSKPELHGWVNDVICYSSKNINEEWAHYSTLILATDNLVIFIDPLIGEETHFLLGGGDTLLIYGDTLFVVSYDTVTAYDLTSSINSPIWSRSFDEKILSEYDGSAGSYAVAIDNGVMHVLTESLTMYKIDSSSGEIKSEVKVNVDLKGEVIGATAMSIYDGVLYTVFVNYSRVGVGIAISHVLVALDTKYYGTIWETIVADAVPPGIYNGVIYTCGAFDVGKRPGLAFDAKTGNILFQASAIASPHKSPVIHEQGILLISSWAGLYAYDAYGGELLWEWPSSSERLSVSSVCLVRDIAYFGLNNGTIYALDVKTQEITFRTDVGKQPQTIVALTSFYTSYTIPEEINALFNDAVATIQWLEDNFTSATSLITDKQAEITFDTGLNIFLEVLFAKVPDKTIKQRLASFIAQEIVGRAADYLEANTGQPVERCLESVYKACNGFSQLWEVTIRKKVENIKQRIQTMKKYFTFELNGKSSVYIQKIRNLFSYVRQLSNVALKGINIFIQNYEGESAAIDIAFTIGGIIFTFISGGILLTIVSGAKIVSDIIHSSSAIKGLQLLAFTYLHQVDEKIFDIEYTLNDLLIRLRSSYDFPLVSRKKLNDLIELPPSISENGITVPLTNLYSQEISIFIKVDLTFFSQELLSPKGRTDIAAWQFANLETSIITIKPAESVEIFLEFPSHIKSWFNQIKSLQTGGKEVEIHVTITSKGMYQVYGVSPKKEMAANFEPIYGELLFKVKTPNFTPKEYWKVTIFSPISLLIIDPKGRRLGYVDNNTFVNEISGAFYTGIEVEPQYAIIPDPVCGKYVVVVYGNEDGNYTIIFEYKMLNGTLLNKELLTLDIKKGEYKKYEVIVLEFATIIPILLLLIAVMVILKFQRKIAPFITKNEQNH